MAPDCLQRFSYIAYISPMRGIFATASFCCKAGVLMYVAEVTRLFFAMDMRERTLAGL